MTRSENIEHLATALSAAQAKIRGALKESEAVITGTVKRKYADLSNVWEACREPLTTNGLAVTQSPSADGVKVTVTTMLMHKSGQWIEDQLSLVSTQNTPQAIGSAITYARRYSLAAIVGVCPEDDDGEEASKGSKEAAKALGEEKVKRMKKEIEPTAPVSHPPPSHESHPTAQSGPPVDYKMLDSFAAIKAEFINEGRKEDYYAILGLHGFEKSNEIRPAEKARPIYREMAQRLKDIRDQKALELQ